MADEWTPGPTGAKATHEIQGICDQVKCQVENKTGTKYDIYEAVKYTKNTGTVQQFLIKVNVGTDDYILLWVKKEHHTYKLHDVKENETADSPLATF